MAKLPDTSQTAIAITFLVMNLSRILRQIRWAFFCQFFLNVTCGSGRIKKSNRWVHQREKSLLVRVTSLANSSLCSYGVTFSASPNIELDERAVAREIKQSGRFILATNVLDSDELDPDKMLSTYKQQQSAERGFSFLKDPLFFTDSVFLKSSERRESLALIMGLCLLVYT